MIDLEQEDPVTLREALRFPFMMREGQKRHLATIHCWASGGVRGVQLETVQVGGSRCTTKEALLRFFERLTNPEQALGRRTLRQRRSAIEQAEKELSAAGF